MVTNTSTVRMPKRDTVIHKGETRRIACLYNIGLVERQTPILFEPDVDVHVHPGIEISPAIEMLKMGNYKKVFVQITNHTAHDKGSHIVRDITACSISYPS